MSGPLKSAQEDGVVVTALTRAVQWQISSTASFLAYARILMGICNIMNLQFCQRV
jgi:hypothetical protein